jgi:hypothetical protein
MSEGPLKHYTPIWVNMVDSSIWMEPLHVRVLWVTMLLMKGKSNVVWANPFVLHRRANLTMDQVEDGLKVLSAPDKLRPGQKHDGRRIEAVDGGEGWLILNGEEYQGAYQRMCAAGRAKRHRDKKAGKLPKNGKPLAGETAYLAAARRGVADEKLDGIVAGSLPDRSQQDAEAGERTPLD